jgi:hypothetical protein
MKTNLFKKIFLFFNFNHNNNTTKKKEIIVDSIRLFYIKIKMESFFHKSKCKCKYCKLFTKKYKPTLETIKE